MKQKERLIAEQIYDNTIDVREEGVYLYMRTKDGWRWILFKPSQDAEQCIKLITVFKPLMMKVDGIWIVRIQRDFIGKNTDFKTAVVLAAAEYIEQNKNQ